MRNDPRENQTIGRWIEETVRILMRDHRQEVGADDMTPAMLDEAVRALEHRLAIGLLQARAFECRKIGNEFLIHGNMVAGTECLTRSHNLEALGMELANGPWPIPRVEIAQ
ncbi:MAG: hypothetical protein K0Q71_2127 [Thermomicrobiales bacterium]|jgi:hypothetical protein|nr:hypothetical protein [Thermomicrobiales bacterium]